MSVAYDALVRLWGNEEWSASPEFCEAAVHLAQQSESGIVECGSGLTTLLLTEAAPKRVLTLEHDRAWFTKVCHRVDPAKSNVIYAPLVPHEDEEARRYEWYDLPAEPFKDRTFSLVVVDGPPGYVLGGRYGAIPRLLPWLTDEFTVLLDDVQREAESSLPAAWERYVVWVDRELHGASLNRKHMVLHGRRRMA